MTAAKRYGAYHRISRMNGRELEDESTITDKDAFDQIDAWARMRGIAEPDRYLDTDQSGSKLSRPELDRMLADLDAGRIDGIIVAQVDRLSRADVGDALITVKRIVGDDEAHPRPLVLLDLGIDPSTEFGELGLTILLGLARMQWRRYKRQWSSAQKRAVKRGVWIGPAPLGYRKTVVGHTKKGKPIYGPLERDPATWTVVRDAYLIAARDGLHAAGAHLAKHLPTMRWITTDVRRVLSNRAYLGEHHAGGQAHEPITTLATWEAAQTDPRSRRSNGAYLLSGVATCENCGADLVGALQSVGERSYRRMRCAAMCKGGVGSIAADKLEGHVRDLVAAKLGNAEFRKLITPAGKDEAEAKLAAAEDDLDRFQVATEGLPVDAIRRGMATRLAAVESARDELRQVAETSARRESLPASTELGDPAQLLRAIRAMTTGVTVAGGRGPIGDRVRVVFVGDDLDDRPGMLAA